MDSNGRHQWCSAQRIKILMIAGGNHTLFLRTLMQKQSGGLFLARGRVPPASDASRRDVDETGTGSMPKSVGMVYLLQKSISPLYPKRVIPSEITRF